MKIQNPLSIIDTSTTLNLGSLECGGFLTASSSEINFSIPTGRVLSHSNISKLICKCMIRCNGTYILSSTTVRTDPAILSTESRTEVGVNNAESTAYAKMTASLQGQTNIRIRIYFYKDSTSSTLVSCGGDNNTATGVYVGNIALTLS